MSDERANYGLVKLYTPSGVPVTLPVTEKPLDYRGMMASVEAMLAAGFLVTAPGLEAGEQREEVGWVLRRTKTNDDKSKTPIIDLYSADDGMTWKVLSVYLNRDEDVAAFEHAAGTPLSALRSFPGTAAPERGASDESDQFIVRVPRPFGVVYVPNPKYSQAEADAATQDKPYRVPKKKFLRWADQSPAAPRPAAQERDEPLVERPKPPAEAPAPQAHQSAGAGNPVADVAALHLLLKAKGKDWGDALSWLSGQTNTRYNPVTVKWLDIPVAHREMLVAILMRGADVAAKKTA